MDQVEAHVRDHLLRRFVVLNEAHEESAGVLRVPELAAEQICGEVGATELEVVVLGREPQREVLIRAI